MSERKQVCIYCSKKFMKEISVYDFIQQEDYRMSNFSRKIQVLLSDLCPECAEEYKAALTEPR